MSIYALEVLDLTKKIGRKTIVDQVSFQVQRGEIFGLLGPNGAGKTTIIRMIVNLMKRTNGKVIVNGYDLDQSFTNAMNELGAIVENPEFYKYLSGHQNLRHYARMALTEVTEEQIEEVSALVGLESAIHDKVSTYSLGMRQRLGVAQAILHRPSLLILDEPTNGLDPQGIREFRDYLKQLASQGTSVLVSSHLLSEMELMCDRFAIIEQGKLIHISSISDEELNEGTANRSIEIEVSDTNKASELIHRLMLLDALPINNDQKLAISMKKSDIPRLTKILVEHGIDVFEIKNVITTLEDRFLEITNKENKEVQK